MKMYKYVLSFLSQIECSRRSETCIPSHSINIHIDAKFPTCLLKWNLVQGQPS
ncbi:hypothetical protein DsansV1_C35g0231461 [Dioscorea sansibarensis]